MTETNETETKNMPKRTYKAGHYKTAIWVNDTMKGEQQSITLSKSILNPVSGAWTNQNITVFPREIQDMLFVLYEAGKYCRVKTTGVKE